MSRVTAATAGRAVAEAVSGNKLAVGDSPHVYLHAYGKCKASCYKSVLSCMLAFQYPSLNQSEPCAALKGKPESTQGNTLRSIGSIKPTDDFEHMAFVPARRFFPFMGTFSRWQLFRNA